jgi:hypothetical protein
MVYTRCGLCRPPGRFDLVPDRQRSADDHDCTPAAGAVFTQNQPSDGLSSFCADAGIGVQSCTVTGLAFIHVGARDPPNFGQGTDRFGKSRTVTVSYEVKAKRTGKIVFPVRTGSGDQPDGTGLSQLTGLPDWIQARTSTTSSRSRPDGRKVVFARRSTASGARQLWVIERETQSSRDHAVRSRETTTGSAWSPDGSKDRIRPNPPGLARD